MGNQFARNLPVKGQERLWRDGKRPENTRRRIVVNSINLVALETFAKVHDLTSSDRLPEIELPVKGKLESEFAVEVGAILDQEEAVFLYNNQVIEIQNQELSGELDRNKLASGGLRFSELTAVRAKTFIEDFVKPGVS